MKKLITLLFLCGTAYSQVYVPIFPTIYGQHNLRTKSDSTQHIPEKVSLQKNTYDTSCQIFYLKSDSSVWAYSKARGYFKLGGSGIGGNPLSYISASSINDSTFRLYRDNGDSTTIVIKGGVSTGGGGSSYYQTVQNAGVSGTQRIKLNFGSEFLVSDNSGNNSSDITVYAISQSKITGLADSLHDKFRYADSSSMLTNYRHWLAGYLKSADVAAMISDSINANHVTWQYDGNDGLSILNISGDTAYFRNLFAGYCITLSFIGDSVMKMDIDSSCLSANYLRKTDTTNSYPRFFSGSNISITGTFPNLTISSTGGGSQTPWTSNIDADQYSLQNLKDIEIKVLGAGADTSQNLVIWSDSLSHVAAWDAVTNNLSVTDNALGNIDLLTGTFGSNNLRQDVTVTPGVTYYLSLKTKRGTSTDISYAVFDLVHYVDIVPTTSYYSSTSSTLTKITFPFTVPSGCTTVALFPVRNIDNGGTVYAGEIQLSTSPTFSYVQTSGTPIDTTYGGGGATSYVFKTNSDGTRIDIGDTLANSTLTIHSDIKAYGIDSTGTSTDELIVLGSTNRLKKIAQDWVNGTTTISSSPNSNGISITGRQIRLHAADASNGGVINTTTQAIPGFKYFPNSVGLGTITSSSTSSALLEGALNLNGFLRLIFTNSSNGSNAATGFLLNNDLGNTGQFYMGSSTNGYIADGFYLRTNGAGGMRVVIDGTGHPWFKIANIGLGGGSIFGVNDTAMYHVAIPKADFNAGKTVILYDTAHGGRFSQISIDSLKESRAITVRQVVGTNANITAIPGTIYALPAATLSTNRTIDVSALNADRDYIEIDNLEAGFTWSFTGATVYLQDGTTTVTNLAVGYYKFKRINGKIKQTN